MSKRLFANLGFLLQISGLLTLLPIAVGLVYNETQAVISLFLACVAFLGCGFLLNALCERKSLDFKGSNFLFLATFVIIPLIGAIPFIYVNPFQTPSPVDLFTNSYFESISGFTTTGFSFISAPELLPLSLLVYRSITEIMGGIGIVFLLLAFFQSRKSLNNLSNSAGIENVCGSLKKTYFSVFVVYAAIISVFIALYYALGFTNVITTGTFVVDTLTGGFQPSANQFTQYLSLAPKIGMIALMLLGALNFAFIYGLFTGKLRKPTFFEFALFVSLIGAGTIIVSATSSISGIDSLFHVVSMSGSVGISYLPLSAFSQTGLAVVLTLMLIGGCAFSMAGGIRISRLIASGQAVKQGIVSLLVKEHVISKPKKLEGNGNGNGNGNGSLDGTSAWISIVLFISVLVVFALVFTTMGVSFSDAIFEVGSALTTNGISMGATTITMGVGYKWLLIAAMTIGRVEILSIMLALFSIGRK